MKFIPGGSFDAQTLQALGEAFDYVCDALRGFGRIEMTRETIAKRIVEVAKTGEHDPVRIRETVLKRWASRTCTTRAHATLPRFAIRRGACAPPSRFCSS